MGGLFKKNDLPAVPLGKFFSRTFHCPKCAAAKRPYKGLKCLFFGSGRDSYFWCRIPSLKGSHPYGLTPHLVALIDDKRNPNKQGLVGIYVYCGISGCGIKLSYNHQRDMHEFTLLKEERREYWLPRKDAERLIKDSAGYGFKI